MKYVKVANLFYKIEKKFDIFSNILVKKKADFYHHIVEVEHSNSHFY